MLIDIKQEAAGKWASVFTLLGMDNEHFTGKHTGCPICGPGRNKHRFRWNKRTEIAHCNQCGSMNPMDLVIAWTGRPYRESAGEVRQLIGKAKVTTTQKPEEQDYAKNLAKIEQVKPYLRKLNGNDPVSLYLRNRGIEALPQKHIWYTSNKPAMAALFSTPDGQVSTLQITYLTADGQKADVPVQKYTMPVARPMTGGAIRMFEPVDGVLGVAEGIETALAAHEMDGVPVWATLSAGLLKDFLIPAGIRELIIYGDNDSHKSYTGEAAAYSLAARAKREKIESVKVFIPELRGTDYADVLAEKKQQESARRQGT